MKAIAYSILLILLATQSYAQNLISVQNSGTPTFFTKLTDAITSAQSGDTIYIPGGSFGDVLISKKLHLIGVGNHPDSADVTSRTIISNIILSSGSDNSSFTGIYNSNLSIEANLSGVTFSRCYLYYARENNSVNSATNFAFDENIIGFLYLMNGSNNSVKNNCFFYDCIAKDSGIKNNAFGRGYSFSYCLIENNIFNILDGYSDVRALPNSICHNNVNMGFNGIQTEYNIQGSGNFLDHINFQSIFVNYDPALIAGDDIYKADFHLKSNSPYKNAGRDFTDIGIYGGAFPWKEGSTPANPHFQRINISPKTDNIGNLNEKIKVDAQDN